MTTSSTHDLMIIPPSLRSAVARWKFDKKMSRHNDPKNVKRRAKYVSKAQFKPGRHVRSLNELMSQKAVYWHGLYTVVGWFSCWQMKYALDEIKAKQIRIVVRKDGSHK